MTGGELAAIRSPLTGPADVINNGPTPRFPGDLWFCTVAAGGYVANTLYIHNGTAWARAGGPLLVRTAVSTNQSITATVAPGTDITGLSVATIPDGTHDVKITVSIPVPQITSANWAAFVLQKDGAVVDGGFLNGSQLAETWLGPMHMTYIDVAPTNASHTYKVSAYVSGGTLSTIGNSFPTQNLLIVEQL